MLTPAMRAMPLPLSLLVTRVLADHENRAVAADDLALLAHGLDRRSDLHAPRSTFEKLKENSATSPGDGSALEQRRKTSRVILECPPRETWRVKRLSGRPAGPLPRARGSGSAARRPLSP